MLYDQQLIRYAVKVHQPGGMTEPHPDERISPFAKYNKRHGKQILVLLKSKQDQNMNPGPGMKVTSSI